MSGAERSSGAFSVNEQFAAIPVELMLFQLAGVVRDIVEHCELSPGKNFLEGLPSKVRDDLSIRERTVDSPSHRAQIFPAQVGFDRRAGQFAIRQLDSILWRCQDHFLEELGPDLMAQAA